MRISNASFTPVKLANQQQVRFGTQSPQQPQNTQPLEDNTPGFTETFIGCASLTGGGVLSLAGVAVAQLAQFNRMLTIVPAVAGASFGIMGLGLIAAGQYARHRSRQLQATRVIPSEGGIELQHPTHQPGTQDAHEIAIV